MHIDSSSDTLKYKIRNAQTSQVPYMLVVGGREEEAGAVGVRHRRQADLGSMDLEAFVQRIAGEIDRRQLDEA